MLLTIDPGADCGWALFAISKPRKGQTPPNDRRGQTPPNDRRGQTPPGGYLFACGLRVMPDSWPAPITRIVIERPHTGKTRARAKDIITLAIRAGEVGGIWSYITGVTPEYIEPNRWKGGLSKARSNKIVLSQLNPAELAILNKIKAKGAKHNVLDAIGIGLFSLGR